MVQGREDPELDSLYLTLPSNGGGPQYASTNTNTQYKVKLPYRLQLPGQGWQVALSSITVPRPAVTTDIHQVHKVNLRTKIPDNGLVASVIIGLYMDFTPQYKRSSWVTMGEVLNHPSVHDGPTFMKRLKQLLDRNMFQLFYTNSGLRRTKFSHGRDTGIRGYPQLYWHEAEGVFEVDWSDTDDDMQFELSLGRAFAELIGAVSWHDGDAVNEWHYGSHLTLAPKYNSTVNTPGYLRGHNPPDLLGPRYYSNNGGFFGFRNHAKYWFINNQEWYIDNTLWTPEVPNDTTMYVYTNVGQGTVVGDQITDLLRQVPLQQDPKDGYLYFEPKNLHYIKVRNTEFDVVEIALGKPEGGLIQLAKGITTLTLHFRRVP